jgi:hypothetical protein
MGQLLKGAIMYIDRFDEQVMKADPTKYVEVYRNLHKKCWSVRQNGIVLFHCRNICLKNVRFYVSERGRQRVLFEHQKNIHAWVIGYIVQSTEIDDNTKDGSGLDVTYNPYKYDSFVLSKSDQIRLKGAAYADLTLWEGIPSDCTVMVWNAIPKN